MVSTTFVFMTKMLWKTCCIRKVIKVVWDHNDAKKKHSLSCVWGHQIFYWCQINWPHWTNSFTRVCVQNIRRLKSEWLEGNFGWISKLGLKICFDKWDLEGASTPWHFGSSFTSFYLHSDEHDIKGLQTSTCKKCEILY